MLVQVGDCERLAAVRALRALIVVHLADVAREVRHGELFVAMRTGLLNLKTITVSVVNIQLFHLVSLVFTLS